MQTLEILEKYKISQNINKYLIQLGNAKMILILEYFKIEGQKAKKYAMNCLIIFLNCDIKLFGRRFK